jgi:hypothetical protein
MTAVRNLLADGLYQLACWVLPSPKPFPGASRPLHVTATVGGQIHMHGQQRLYVTDRLWFGDEDKFLLIRLPDTTAGDVAVRVEMRGGK